ncbi:hypothetical protein RB653_001271 [Dictyostelium firmibasis]|uniref:PH domain-containing protein n=1 Tax=Dictyostelium firmibasis TaxID=79012 RepID=A0AAN7Z1Y4_9MYCE
MDSNAIEKSSKEIIEDLQRQLLTEKNRNRTLVEELKQLRDSHARIQIVTENEEEYITNKFMKYLNQLKKEKEELALKVEQEEEYLTNTLQKKMLTIMKEKVDLENQLEQEEEFIVNKLQKQIQDVMKDKKALEKRLENEINDHRSLLKLQDEVIVLRDKIKELESNGNKKEDVDALKAENFVLGQKIIREQEKLSKVNSENTKLMSNLEIDDERNFNKSKRNRSISFPTSMTSTTTTTTSITSSTTSITSSTSSINSSTSSSSSNNTCNNSNNNSNSNIPTSPLSCSSNSSGGSLNNSCNSNCSNGSGNNCSTNSNGNSKLSSGVPITRSRSSSSTSNPCLITKVAKEGWLKRKSISPSTNQEILEKRYYEISTNGEMREYFDETKQVPTSQYINLDTCFQIDIIGVDPNHPGYSDIKLHIKTNSISPVEIITFSTSSNDCNDWKETISSLMPSKR